jgi:hypothetical protein
VQYAQQGVLAQSGRSHARRYHLTSERRLGQSLAGLAHEDICRLTSAGSWACRQQRLRWQSAFFVGMDRDKNSVWDVRCEKR